MTNRELTGEQKLMFTDMNAPAVLVAFVALGAYFASGAFAAVHFAARRRIVKRLLERDAEVVEALLTYPSVVARVGSPQIVALACIGGTGMIALLVFYVPTHEWHKALAAAVVIGSPYVLLLAMAIRTAFDERDRPSRG